jgi:hypothetical protein
VGLPKLLDVHTGSPLDQLELDELLLDDELLLVDRLDKLLVKLDDELLLDALKLDGLEELRLDQLDELLLTDWLLRD